MLTEEKKVDQSIPLLKKDIVFFFLKVIALIVIWQCGYYFVLGPARIPDKSLTDIITAGVTFCMNIVFHSPFKFTWNSGLTGDNIGLNGKIILVIADGCNGLNLMAIYMGFIILLPSAIKRKIIFSLGGIIALILANIIRCVSLYWIYKYHTSEFEVNHHYVFSILMYLLIFYGWVLFTKGGKINEAR